MNLGDPFLFFPPSGLRLFLDFHGFFHKCPKKNWKLRPQKVWKKWTVSNFRGKGLPAKSGKNLGIRKHLKGWIDSVIFCWSTEILEVWPGPRWLRCPDQQFVKVLAWLAKSMKLIENFVRKEEKHFCERRICNFSFSRKLNWIPTVLIRENLSLHRGQGKSWRSCARRFGGSMHETERTHDSPIESIFVVDTSIEWRKALTSNQRR